MREGALVRSRERLEEDARRLSAQIARAQLELSRTLAELGGLDGFSSEWRSIGHWAGWNLGVTGHEAKRYEHVADRSPSLPALTAAMESGALTLSAAASVMEVATPDTDAELAELCRHATGSQIQQICRTSRPAAETSEPEEFIRVTSDRGGHRLTAWMASDTAEQLNVSLDAALEQLWNAVGESGPPVSEANGSGLDNAVDEGETTEPHAPVAGDVTARAASTASADDSRSEEGTAPRPTRVDALRHVLNGFLQGEGATTGNGADRWMGFVHIDLESGGRLSDGTELSEELVGRIMCDAGLSFLLSVDGRPAWITDRSPTAPGWMRRVLNSRSKGTCEVEGCTAVGYLEAHHIHHRSRGGATCADNLGNTCPWHHRLAHRPGHHLIKVSSGSADGGMVLRIVRDDGSDLSRKPPPPDPPALEDASSRPPRGGDRLTNYALSVWSEYLANAA